MELCEPNSQHVNELIGSLSWKRFFSRHATSVSLLIASVVVPLFSLWRGAGNNLIVDAFSLLVGTSSLLHLIIWMTVLTTHFHLVDGSLTFSRPCRRTRTVFLPDVAGVYDELDASTGADVWLRDGTTLAIRYEELSNSQELVAILRERGTRDAILEGGLNRNRVAQLLVHQWLAACFLTAVALAGCICIAVYLRPGNLMAAPFVFLSLGLVLLSLSAVGFYAAILRFWLGSVRWFQWDGVRLRYRTMFSAEQERYIDEFDTVSTRRPNSPKGEAGAWRVIGFRNGERLKLLTGCLLNSEELFLELKKIIEERSAGATAEPITRVTPEHPLWSLIAPHLATGESALWVGNPVWGKLWSEMSAEIVFGLIPGAFGIGMLAIVYHVGIKQGNFELWPFLIGGLIFGGIGGWMCAAPWRFRKMLKNTVYAVTTHRVLIIHGIEWGLQWAVQTNSIDVQAFEIDQVQFFEIAGRRRDILLGGQWKRGRKGSQIWVHSGFLAANEPDAAASAIRQLIKSRS